MEKMIIYFEIIWEFSIAQKLTFLIIIILHSRYYEVRLSIIITILIHSLIDKRGVGLHIKDFAGLQSFTVHY